MLYKTSMKPRASAETFSGGAPIRVEPVLITKSGRIFEMWEVKERGSKNPGRGHGFPTPPPPPPPLLTPMHEGVEIQSYLNLVSQNNVKGNRYIKCYGCRCTVKVYALKTTNSALDIIVLLITFESK